MRTTSSPRSPEREAVRRTRACASRVRRALVLTCLVALSLVPASGRAWTDTGVLEAEAEVTLHDDDEADVALTLVVEVRDGWLAQLELADLAPELTLAEQEPVVLVTERGARLMPSVHSEGGTLALTFVRERAPQRGVHHVLVRYRARALRRTPLTDGRERISFGLPGWEGGLTRAAITLRASHALTAVEDDLIAQQIETSPEGTRVRYERVHLPRSTPWEVAVDRRVSAAAPVARADAASPSASSWLRPRFAGSVLLVLLLALLTRQRALLRGRAIGLMHPGRGRARHALALLLAVAAVLVVGREPIVAPGMLVLVPLLLAPRLRAPAAALVGGRFVPIDPARRRQAERHARRWLHGLTPLDGTTLLGASVLAGWLALVLALPGALALADDPYGLALACVAPTFFLGARLRFPRDLDERLALLSRAARRCSVSGCALRLLGYVDADGVLRDPRLRVVPTSTPPGLVRIEVLADTRRDVPALVVAVTVEPGSTCARALERALPEARVEHDPTRRRSCLLQSTASLDLVLEALLEGLVDARRQARPSTPPPRAPARAA